MICRHCIRAAARTRISQLPSSQSSRFLSTTPNVATQATPRQSSPSSHTPPTATSTSTTRPLNEPSTPSAKKEASIEKTYPTIKSSVPGGTPLRGINFLKNQSDPIAMEDSEYPSWLWEVLQKQEKKAEAGAAGDLFSKSKKQRRLAAKRLRKEQLANPELLIPKVPIYEQTIDLPSGDGTLEGALRAAGARGELTKAMRNKRRAAIKEANFLKAMR